MDNTNDLPNATDAERMAQAVVDAREKVIQDTKDAHETEPRVVASIHSLIGDGKTSLKLFADPTCQRYRSFLASKGYLLHARTSKWEDPHCEVSWKQQPVYDRLPEFRDILTVGGITVVTSRVLARFAEAWKCRH